MAAVHAALGPPQPGNGSAWDPQSQSQGGSEGPGDDNAVDSTSRPVGRVYVHSTAGLGRAPAVCIAYMYGQYMGGGERRPSIRGGWSSHDP